MRISDWSSDVCSSDLSRHIGAGFPIAAGLRAFFFRAHPRIGWQGAWPLADGACANARLAGGGRTVLGPYLYAGPSNGTGILLQLRLHTLTSAGDRKRAVKRKGVTARLDLGGPRVYK